MVRFGLLFLLTLPVALGQDEAVPNKDCWEYDVEYEGSGDNVFDVLVDSVEACALQCDGEIWCHYWTASAEPHAYRCITMNKKDKEVHRTGWVSAPRKCNATPTTHTPTTARPTTHAPTTARPTTHAPTTATPTTHTPTTARPTTHAPTTARPTTHAPTTARPTTHTPTTARPTTHAPTTARPTTHTPTTARPTTHAPTTARPTTHAPTTHTPTTPAPSTAKPTALPTRAPTNSTLHLPTAAPVQAAALGGSDHWYGQHLTAEGLVLGGGLVVGFVICFGLRKRRTFIMRKESEDPMTGNLLGSGNVQGVIASG